MINVLFFIVVFCQDADVIVTDLASAIKQIFPTVPLKYIIRKVMCHTLIHRMHSCVVVINADPLSFCIYLLPSPMFVVRRLKFSQVNVKQYFPMSCDHPIREMLDHAVALVDNMRACVISMASLTGNCTFGRFFSLLFIQIRWCFLEMKLLGILIRFTCHTIHEYWIYVISIIWNQSKWRLRSCVPELIFCLTTFTPHFLPFASAET